MVVGRSFLVADKLMVKLTGTKLISCNGYVSLRSFLSLKAGIPWPSTLIGGFKWSDGGACRSNTCLC